MKHLSDAQLIHITIAGNRTAFGILVERYHEMVLRVAYRTLGQTDVAHDMAQEALLQAFLSLKQLHNPSRFRSWLYGITLNVCRDFLRMQRANLVSFESLAGGVYIADDMPSPETLAEQIELRQTIQRAIQTLTEANRAVVLLHYYEGFSTRDIAEVLDISVSAVKVRLHKARQQLRTYLEVMLPTIQTQHEGAKDMIPVKIVDVMTQTYDANGQEVHNYQVVLFDEQTRRALVIWIGELEAIAIAMGMSPSNTLTNNITRPVTQQFMMNLVKATGATVEAVELSKLENDIYYATVRIKSESGAVHIVDARPSDALGMAVWNNVPIFASPELWKKASPPLPEGLKATRKGINTIIARLEGKASAVQTWIKHSKEQALPEKVDHDEHMRRMARGVLDEVFE